MRFRTEAKAFVYAALWVRLTIISMMRRPFNSASVVASKANSHGVYKDDLATISPEHWDREGPAKRPPSEFNRWSISVQTESL